MYAPRDHMGSTAIPAFDLVRIPIEYSRERPE